MRSSPTLDDWMDVYLRNVASERVRPRTLQSYQDLYRLHVQPELGRARLDSLTPDRLALLYRRLAGDLAPSSVRKVHALLRRALKVAVRWEHLARNPAEMVDAPQLTTRDVSPYSSDEATQLLRAAARDRLAARWHVALMLGMRQGEVLGLKWADVDLQGSVLRVERSLQRDPTGALVMVPPKTRASRRPVPLSASLARSLQRRRALRDAERAAAGSEWVEHDLVFSTRQGKPINPRNDYRSFRTLVARAELRPVRLHDLRRTTATLLLTAGVPARVVMEILGHSQISVTMNAYTHVGTDVARDAVGRLEGLLQLDSHDFGSTVGSPERGPGQNAAANEVRDDL